MQVSIHVLFGNCTFLSAFLWLIIVMPTQPDTILHVDDSKEQSYTQNDTRKQEKNVS